MADTGWVIAGTGENNTGTGSFAWVNPTRVSADDASYATAGPLSAGQETYYLLGRSFGLSVPSGATIDGIEVRFEGYWTGSSICSITCGVRHPSSGFLASAGEDALATSPTTYTYGGSLDLHDASWTAANVNDANFGVYLSCAAVLGSNVNPLCDYIAVKVYYTPAAASGGTRAHIIG
jgi:hypothetical protein